MLLVQISDIHCGSQFRKAIFEEAVREINALKPEGILVTGDLTEDGLVKEYQQAYQVLEQIDAKKLVLCSGNHDYRTTGYYLYHYYFQPEPVVELGDTVFVTIGTARPERNDGEVGYRQIVWLKETLDKYENKRKIVAMHHHALPVPDTGTDRIVLVDAGDLLRVLNRSRVDVVFCGHRHRPWIWRLEDFTVITAGTLSSERTRGFFVNSYNIVELLDDEVKADLKVVGGKRFPLQNVLGHEYLHLPPKK